MKLRKLAVALFLTVFIGLTTVCQLFGPTIRDRLSRQVKFVYPEYADIDGKYCLVVPDGAVTPDGYDSGYVYVAEVSDKYPEYCFEVHKKEVGIYLRNDDSAVISYGLNIGDKVVLTNGIADGERVILNN